MPIYYCLLAKEGNVVLCDYSSYSGNFSDVAESILERVQPNSMKTIELEEQSFHYLNDENITALCMADKKFNRKQAFAFLQDTKKALLEYYTTRDLERA